ncbi:MAG TPA: MFS transporter [Marmoricola sp.]
MSVETPVAPAVSDPGPTLVQAAGRSYFPIALAARLPFAMMVVGVLTLVVEARGSLTLAGLNSAMVGLGTAVFGPLLGILVDRFGQRRVVLAGAAANSLALVALCLVVYSDLPDAAVLGVAFCIGATAPQVSPLSRSRLVGIITGKLAPGRRAVVFNATMAYESAADELIFIIGPFLVGVLATVIGPVAPVVGGAVLTAVFVGAFALHPSGAPREVTTRTTSDQAPLKALLAPELLTVLVGVLGMGLYFGTTLTGLTAFLDDRGLADRAGLVYGVMGIGSACFALAVAKFPTGFTRQARWLVFGAILLAGSALYPWVGGVGTMAAALLVAGIGIGPTLVTQYSLGARRSPLGRSATVMTMLGSAIIVGQSAASALGGALAQGVGTHAALLAPMCAAALVVAAGAADTVLVRRSGRELPSSPGPSAPQP